MLSLCGTAAARVQAQNDTLDLRIYYRQGDARLDEDYRQNGAHLSSVLDALRRLADGSPDAVRRLEIVSGASPEGRADFNLHLSRRRTNVLGDYLRTRMPHSLFTRMDTRSLGVDWDGLERLVEQSDMPHRDTVLHILRHTPEWVLTNGVVTDSRKRQLGMLAGGGPWRYMERHFFPSLRCSHLRVYTDGPLQTATDGAAIPCPVQDTIYIERERSVSPSAAIAFAPEMQPADSASTRVLSSVGLPADTVVPLHASSGSPLYLHTLYADTIASASRTGEVDAPAPVRALPVGTDNFYGTFGVSAYAYTGDWSDDCTPNYMYDVAVAPSGKLWASANTYYWPGSACRLRFFAYAPRGNAAYTFSGADAAGAPTLRCVIPAGAKIEILFNDGTEDHLLTASIGGTLWPMGKTVTYRISTTSINWVYTLEAKGPRPYSFRGEYDEYAVTSYRTHVVTGQQEPVAWSETYSLDGGKSWTDVPPRWTNSFVGSGEGSTKPRSYSLYVREQTPVVHNGAAEKLMNTPPKGTADRPWNLSNRTGADAVENTANCYVINGPGHYSFPLVYGNAIRNGADNPAAYSSTSTNPYVLKQFVNYINYPITRPYIDEGYAYPLTSAEILWQDEPGLVTDVRYHAEPGRGTISFAVPRETIKEGNAVIVLKDERGQVIWSWHIWVTSADVEQTIRVKTFHAKEAYVHVFEFMPINLGWCGMAEVEYPGLPCAARHGIHPLCGPEGGTARHGRCQRHVGRHAERLPLLLRRDEVRHGLPAYTGHEDLCERKGRQLCHVRILLDSGQCLSRP